jgi:hypothetical protein
VEQKKNAGEVLGVVASEVLPVAAPEALGGGDIGAPSRGGVGGSGRGGMGGAAGGEDGKLHCGRTGFGTQVVQKGLVEARPAFVGAHDCGDAGGDRFPISGGNG